MDNNKHVLESFNEFLKYRVMELNEKEGSPGANLDIEGVKGLISIIMADNGKLAENLYSGKTDTIKGRALDKASKALVGENSGLAGVYSILGNLLDHVPSKEEIEMLKELGVDVGKNPEVDLKSVKNRIKKMEDSEATISKLDSVEAGKKAEAALKKAPANMSYTTYIASAIATPFIWGLLKDADKEKVYQAFLMEAGKKGYSDAEGLKKVISDEFKEKKSKDLGRMNSPGIQAFLTKTESVVVASDEPTPKVFKTAIVKEDKQSEVFKPNMYGANGEADYMEGTFTEMTDNLGAIFQRMLTGEIASIKSITVYTSADRYRNTGSAEKLSWGQLSFLRSQSMASVVVAMAQKSGLPADIVTTVNTMISLNFKGGNGDGTTGPNAPGPIKFGYYIDEDGKSVWKDGKSRDIIQVVEVDNEGTPKGEPKDVKKSPDANKDEYNKYRYNNIEIEYLAAESKSDKPGEDGIIGKVVELKYPIKIKLPARYKRKTIKIPIPVIRLGISASGGAGKTKSTTKCPDFGSSGGGVKVRTSFGFGIKTVTVSSWQSDLTK